MQDLLIQHCFVIVIKGQGSTHKCIQNDTHRPDVDGLARVAATIKHFRCRVQWCATTSIKGLMCFKLASEPKVTQLHLALSIE